MAEIRKTGLYFPCLSVFIVIEYSLCEFESRLVTRAGDTAGCEAWTGPGISQGRNNQNHLVTQNRFNPDKSVALEVC